jgi:hypothetical protein
MANCPWVDEYLVVIASLLGLVTKEVDFIIVLRNNVT